MRFGEERPRKEIENRNSKNRYSNIGETITQMDTRRDDKV